MVRYTFERGIMPKETAHSGAKVRQKAAIEVLGQDQCLPKVGGLLQSPPFRRLVLNLAANLAKMQGHLKSKSRIFGGCFPRVRQPPKPTLYHK
jgi:hypothetical protein